MYNEYMTNILVAYGENYEIGKDNDLPWRRGLPSDLKRFSDLTTAKSVIMGRNTYESLPPRYRPLPDRENIVLSRNPDFVIPGVLCVDGLAQAIKSAKSQDIFIIGGAQVYEEALPIATKIFATEVKASFPEADTFFPEIDKNVWQETAREHLEPSKKTGDKLPFDFVVYERQK
jgi:dihydrofolate reductase